MIDLILTEYELWAVHDYVRQGAPPDYGREWAQDFERRVMAAILAAGGEPNRTVPITLEETELWLIDRQVPSALMVGTQRVGHDLLLKVMTALTAPAADPDTGPGTMEVGTPYETAFRADDAALEGFNRWMAEKSQKEMGT